MIKIGYNTMTEKPIKIDILDTGQLCCVGGTGSGKSMSVLYLLYNMLKYAKEEHCKIELYICDFKKSGDFEGITNNYAEFKEVTGLIEQYYEAFENTMENSPIIKILLIDEYAGYMVWLTQNDKKKAEKIKSIISTILMTGRSRHCYAWCVQQRISASLFPAEIGAIDNFQICLGMGRLSVESRKSLFAGEHLADRDYEERYHPKTGQGLVLIDGQDIQPIQIPYIKDKEKLKRLLRKMSKNISG